MPQTPATQTRSNRLLPAAARAATIAVVANTALYVVARLAGGPLSLNATLASKVTLEVMHLVVAASVVVELMRALEPLQIVRERSVRGPSEATA